MKSLPKEILVASNNQGKIREISDLLGQVNILAKKPSELEAFNNFQEPEETGSTFGENSLIKAKFYAKKSGLISLADDSGLCIHDLENQPGIHSARFALDKNNKTNFNFAFEKIFNALAKKGIEPQKNEIRAHFICNLTIFDPKTEYFHSFEGRVDGKIVKPKGSLGFGYDPIFIKDDMQKTFGEIAAKEKDAISHRGDAFKKLLAWLQQI
jgi:XTP/dITP diphosphohydrolase